RRRRRRRLVAGQDAQARPRAAVDQDRRQSFGADMLRATGRRDPLDRSCHGQGRGHFAAGRAADLGAASSPAASHPNLQASERPKIRGEGRGCRRPLYEPAGPRRHCLNRREKPDPGARPHPAWLPLKPGKCGTMTHDYKRNGTTTLFAALDILEGTVIGRCMKQHRHQEFIRFLNAVERAVPAGKIIHTVLDNYATHKHPAVWKWLANHPRWTFHFTPTSASWLNAVEGFFSTITRRKIRRGAFKSVPDLEAEIARYIKEHNKSPKPFVWTKPAK